RLQLLEELVRTRPARRRLPEEPRRSLDRRLPRNLVDLVRRAFAARLVERLDLVEVDVLEAVPLLLVEFDVRAAPFRRNRSARDRLLEGRVLPAGVVADDEARVAGLRLVRLHLFDPDGCFGHGALLPAAAAAHTPATAGCAARPVRRCSRTARGRRRRAASRPSTDTPRRAASGTARGAGSDGRAAGPGPSRRCCGRRRRG